MKWKSKLLYNIGVDLNKTSWLQKIGLRKFDGEGVDTNKLRRDI